MADSFGHWIGGVVIGMFLGFVPACVLSEWEFEDKAIKAGVAEYDPQTGEFRWKGDE